jgi:RNA polymerase sigma-32 factor
MDHVMDHMAEGTWVPDQQEGSGWVPPTPDRTSGWTAPSYLQRIQTFPMLSEAEEQRLSDRWYRQGDRQAFEALIASHLRLVPKIAQRYRGYGIPVADLIGEGNVGLLQSAVRFDPTLGYRFSTYARWWIRAAILNHILQTWSLIKVGHGSAKKRMFFNLRRAKARLGRNGQRYLSDADVAGLARKFQVSRDDVVVMDQRLSGQDLSLHQPLQGREGSTVADVLAADDPTPEETAILNDEAVHRKVLVRDALAKLERREREILVKRYLADSSVTLAALAERYGITAERVRQIEARAIGKLRHYLTQNGQAVSDVDTVRRARDRLVRGTQRV